jgi:hypothetical protein
VLASILRRIDSFSKDSALACNADGICADAFAGRK